MDKRDEEDAWRSIVENFGERALLDDELPSAELDPEDLTPPETPRAAPDSPGPFVPGPEHEYAEPPRDTPAEPHAMHDVEGSFRPPTPPLPYVPPKRLLAWATLTLVPVLMIVLSLLDHAPRGLLALTMACAWIGAFGYLVWTMPDEPRDPFDNGARV